LKPARDLDLIHAYLSQVDCETILNSVREFRKSHTLPLIHREVAGRSLRYFVIDGEVVHESFPELVSVYRQVEQVVKGRFGSQFTPLRNRAASVNVNVTPPGGEYRWHYDRNAVTAILYLNTVAGGETEIYPGHRLHLGRWKNTRAQRWLDTLFQWTPVLKASRKRTLISPAQGLLLIMRGDRCLHSVRRVEGSEDRINIVMTFDAPQARFAVEENLDPYLYSKKPAPSFDPNYRQ
jgi:2OG-Fe(II) oxygenase superfamily